MKKVFLFPLPLIFFSLFSNTIDAQTDTKKNDLHEIFDSTIGEEASGIYNGIQYNNEFVVLNEKHQFYDTNNFLEEYVQYNDQDYHNVHLKYDLFYDEIIIRPQNASDGLAFKLIKALVDGFSLNGKTFVNLKAIDLKTNEPIGYCERLSGTELFDLYKKYVKKASKQVKGEQVFYQFNLDHSYYLSYNNVHSRATTRSELIAIFPHYKSIIKDYCKAYRRLLKSDPDVFMKLLLVRLNELEQPKKA